MPNHDTLPYLQLRDGVRVNNRADAQVQSYECLAYDLRLEILPPRTLQQTNGVSSYNLSKISMLGYT